MSDSFQPHGLQHARLPYPPLSPGVCSNSCPLSWWCSLTTSSSAALFSFCLLSFSASGSFSMSWLFASGGQSIEVSASASVLPMNIQCWFPLGLTSLTSFLSKGFPRIFFSTTIQKHQFFSVQPSLWSNSHSVSEYLFRSIHDFCGIRRILFLFTTSPWNSWIYILVGGYPSSSNIQ